MVERPQTTAPRDAGSNVGVVRFRGRMADSSSRTTRRKSAAAKGPRTFAIGSYTAEMKPLGKGGMASVYRARAEDGSVVAIKELLPHLRSDRRMVKRFRQEYEVVSRLDHPNIIRFTDFVVANGTHNIVMEYVDGPSLRQLLRRVRHLPAPLVAALGHQLAEVLRYVHAAEVLHRDIKPSNVLIGTDGGIKLTDFGIAHQAGTRMTATGVVLGSPTYMAPEQLAGKRDEVDERTDVYALAVVLYECLEGRDPFRIRAREDLLAVLHRKVETQPLPPKKATDPEMVEVLLACLRVEPADRLAGAAALASRLAVIAERSGEAPSGRGLGRQLLALGEEKSRKGESRAKGESTTRTVLDRLGRTLAVRRERRAFIWLSVAAATALAVAAFLLAGRG